MVWYGTVDFGWDGIDKVRTGRIVTHAEMSGYGPDKNQIANTLRPPNHISLHLYTFSIFPPELSDELAVDTSLFYVEFSQALLIELFVAVERCCDSCLLVSMPIRMPVVDDFGRSCYTRVPLYQTMCNGMCETTAIGLEGFVGIYSGIPPSFLPRLVWNSKRGIVNEGWSNEAKVLYRL